MCSLCHCIFRNVSVLKLHFKLKHHLNAYSSVQCLEDNCNRNFTTVKTFLAHFKRAHEVPVNRIDQVAVHNVNGNRNNNAEAEPAAQVEPQEIVDDLNHAELENIDFAAALQKQSSQFVSKLSGHPSIPRNACQLIIDYSSELMETVTSLLKLKINYHIQKSGGLNADDSEEINSCFLALQTPFSGLATEHFRIKYFTELGTYVAPVTFTLGQRFVDRRIKGKKVRVTTSVTGQFIPLRNCLKLFLEYQNVFNDTLSNLNALIVDETVLCNFVQGLSFRETLELLNTETNTVFLPLFIYVDDYETGNPLGSHAGSNKLCAVYAMIPCLPPEILSSLDAILLCMLMKSNDRKHFGNKISFKILIKELNFLREYGIKINVNGSVHKVCFLVGLMIGDNLGMNQMLGFVESFSANHPCRICKMSKNALRVQCVEDEALQRNPENYENDLALNDYRITGIKERCVWNAITGFHATTHGAVDFMHDVLEGVAGLDIALILNYFIDAKFFSFEVLCLLIDDFEFGLECRNKLPTFSKAFKNGSLKLTAAEMLILIRYLPLIIGCRIPEDHYVWELFILLHQFVGIVMAPHSQKETSVLLKSIVEEHNKLYLRLSKSHLTFKLHCLVHYPSMFLKFGPIKHLWCMRFEGKHRKSKIAASAICSRRNIAKSVAIKHQLQFCDQYNASTLFSPSITLGPSMQQKACNLLNFDIQEDLQRLNLQDSFLNAAWVKVHGTTYKKDMVLLCSINDVFPAFGQIKKILIFNNDRVCFLCSEIRTVSYERHLCAYNVENIPVHFLVHLSSLFSPLPLSLSTISNGQKYVSLHFTV